MWRRVFFSLTGLLQRNYEDPPLPRLAVVTVTPGLPSLLTSKRFIDKKVAEIAKGL